ncbi:MAG: hypothetical protein WBQ18_17840 [Solirubrobacteraceae bacterium]
MDSNVARRIARANHAGQRTRFGDSVIEHLGNVARGVAPEARAVAWLHDLFELTEVDCEQLRAQGLTDTEETTLELLTRGPADSYDAYVMRIALAPGQAGYLARMIKLADLRDHLAHEHAPPGAPPYAWAHRCVLEHAGTEPEPVPALAV